MKPTAQRLSEVYCRPTTDGEWDELDIQNPLDRKEFPFVMMQGLTAWQVNYTFNRTEIPVSQFIDLIQDAICAWRLENDGFTFCGGKVPYYEFQPRKRITLSWSETTKDSGVALELTDDAEWLNIKTYTQLLTLIELIG